MEMKFDTVSLREIIIKKRYNKERWGDPESYGLLSELIFRVPWSGAPEGASFWIMLYNDVWSRFPEAKDVVLQNGPWR